MPVAGIDPSTIHDTFDEMRGGDTRRHDALDILAPRGTNVVATDDGTVKKLFTSVPGGSPVSLGIGILCLHGGGPVKYESSPVPSFLRHSCPN